MKMKNLFISSCLLIATISIACYISGCKKDDNNSKKLIDEIIGTYIAYDTTIITPVGMCGSDIYANYSFVATKESESTINISKLHSFCEDVKATVTESNITLLPTTSCFTDFNPAVTKAGNILIITYSDIPGAGCSGAGTIKAVKQ